MASQSQIGLSSQQFRIQITVIEARQLSGTNMDPVVKVGEKSRFTTKKTSTKCPYYNEVFVFDYNVLRDIFFYKMITFTVLHSNRVEHSVIFKNSFLL